MWYDNEAIVYHGCCCGCCCTVPLVVFLWCYPCIWQLKSSLKSKRKKNIINKKLNRNVYRESLNSFIHLFIYLYIIYSRTIQNKTLHIFTSTVYVQQYTIIKHNTTYNLFPRSPFQIEFETRSIQHTFLSIFHVHEEIDQIDFWKVNGFSKKGIYLLKYSVLYAIDVFIGENDNLYMVMLYFIFYFLCMLWCIAINFDNYKHAANCIRRAI